MRKKIINKYSLIMIIVFLSINILNAFLSTTSIFNTNLSPYSRNFYMILNSFLGDLGFLSLFIGIGYILFKKERARSRFLMYVTLVLCIILWGMSMYISKYGMLFSFFNLRTFGETNGGDAAAFVLDSMYLVIIGGKIIFLLPFLIMLALFIYLFRIKNSKIINEKYNSLKRVFLGFGIIFVGIGLMILSLGLNKTVNKGSWYEDNSTPLYGTQSVGMFNYYVYNAYTYFNSEKEIVDESKRLETERILENYKSECQINPITGKEICSANDYKGIFNGKNLLLIQSESLNNFVIGLKVKIGDEFFEVTPNLNKLVDKSVYFKNFYTTVGIGNTSDAEFSTLTGIYPTGPTYTVFEYNEVKYETLPKLFNNENYYTFSIHANEGYFYDRTNMHENIYGFNKHYSKEDLVDMGIDKEDLYVHNWLNDADFLRTTVKLIKDNNDLGNPVFSFAITVSNHMPYRDDPSLYRQLDKLFPDDFNLIEESYLGYLKHVYYADYAIGVLLEELESANLLDNTIIGIYGDHGSSIPINTIFKENPGIYQNDINGLFGIDYATTLKEQRLAERMFNQNVPFLIYDPSGSLEPKVISRARGITDIKRTFATLFDLEQEYYFGFDALVDEQTYIYNPRSMDIILDDQLISSSSMEIFRYPNANEYTNIEIDRIINEFKKYKDFNDKLLKYKIFPLIK